MYLSIDSRSFIHSCVMAIRHLVCGSLLSDMHCTVDYTKANKRYDYVNLFLIRIHV